LRILIESEIMLAAVDVTWDAVHQNEAQSNMFALNALSSRAVQIAARGGLPDDIGVWHVPLRFTGNCASDMPFLDAEERAKATRFRNTADQVRFSLTRSVLRELLGVFLGIDPVQVKIRTTSRGKPELASSIRGRLLFNVSHSGAHALIAISRKRVVGVDIELVDKAIAWRELATLVCTPGERKMIEVSMPDTQHEEFYRCWTAKEALLKALGLGITENLLALTIDLRAVERTSLSPQVAAEAHALDALRAMKCCWIRDIPDYSACLAYETDM
jgi:4'-phosphopantetheinyl transferase